MLTTPPPVVDAAARSAPILSGWLWKRGRLRKNWKKRWFVLSWTHLSYYKMQSSKTPQGSLPTSRIFVLPVSEVPEASGLDFPHGYRLCIRLVGGPSGPLRSVRRASDSSGGGGGGGGDGDGDGSGDNMSPDSGGGSDVPADGASMPLPSTSSPDGCRTFLCCSPTPVSMWTSAIAMTRSRDWTGELAQLHTQLEDATAATESLGILRRMRALHHDFHAVAVSVSTAVVRELVLPPQRRSLPMSTARPFPVYSVGSVVAVCCHDADGVFGGDAALAKLEAREVRGLTALVLGDGAGAIRPPLTTMVDVWGTRVVVYSAVPVNPDGSTLMYGLHHGRFHDSDSVRRASCVVRSGACFCVSCCCCCCCCCCCN